MKNTKCPNKRLCWGYTNGGCETCSCGAEVNRIYKRIDRLKKQKETLTIQRNAWALAAKAVKADTVRKMQERLKNIFNPDCSYDILQQIDQIAKEMLEGGDVS